MNNFDRIEEQRDLTAGLEYEERAERPFSDEEVVEYIRDRYSDAMADEAAKLLARNPTRFADAVRRTFIREMEKEGS